MAYYQLRLMRDRHKEMVRRIFLGQKFIDIARDMGVHPSTVGACANSDIVRDRLDGMNEIADKEVTDLQARLQPIARAAVDYLETALDPNVIEGGTDGRSAKDRDKVAFGLMDRAGFGPVSRVYGKHQHAVLTEDMIDRLKQRLDAVDVVPENENETGTEEHRNANVSEAERRCAG